MIAITNPKQDAVIRGPTDISFFAYSAESQLKGIDILVDGKFRLRMSRLDLQAASENRKLKQVQISRKIVLSEPEKDDVSIPAGRPSRIKAILWDERGRCNESEIKVIGGSSDVHALVIGISEYGHLGALKYAHSDAAKFYAYLKDILQVPKKNIKKLINKEANLLEIRKAFEDLRKNVSDKATVVFFFAGHGYYNDGDEIGYPDKAYLATYESDMEYSSTFLPQVELRTMLANHGAGRTVYFIDSCYSSADGARSVSTSSAMRGIISDLWRNFKGTYGMLSSGENEPSLEDETLKGGVFTHYLLESFHESDSDDNEISLDESFEYLKQKVTDWTKGKQIPKKRDNSEGDIDDLPFGFKRN